MRQGRKSRTRALFRTLTPAAVAVTSLTRIGTTATVVTASAHGYATDDRIAIAGANEGAYNGTVVVTVVDPTAFTYAVSGSPATPATGTITATYVSDRVRGTRRVWRDLYEVWGWFRQTPATEQIQAGQVVTTSVAWFDMRYRTWLVPTLQAVIEGRTYEVESVEDRDGRRREVTVRLVDRTDQAA